MKAILTHILAVFAFFFATQASADMVHTKRAVASMIKKEVRNKVPEKTLNKIIETTFRESQKQNIDPLFMLSVIYTESRFIPTAKNKSGARGLTQVMPRYHRDKIQGRNIMNIETNIEVGTTVMVDCLTNNNHNVRAASRCYSGNANRYTEKLKAFHKQAKHADILHRFKNELPLVAYEKFEQPMGALMAQLRKPSKQMVAGYNGT